MGADCTHVATDGAGARRKRAARSDGHTMCRALHSVRKWQPRIVMSASTVDRRRGRRLGSRRRASQAYAV
eukprot:405743-Pyramimonas_sp.AAC.1